MVLIIPSHWKFQFWLVTTLVKMFGVKRLSPLDFQMSLHRTGEDIFCNHNETLRKEKKSFLERAFTHYRHNHSQTGHLLNILCHCS